MMMYQNPSPEENGSTSVFIPKTPAMSVSGSMMVAMMVSVRITSPTLACSSARRMEYCEM